MLHKPASFFDAVLWPGEQAQHVTNWLLLLLLLLLLLQNSMYGWSEFLKEMKGYYQVGKSCTSSCTACVCWPLSSCSFLKHVFAVLEPRIRW
jgi:hypothetical protein